MKKKAVQERRIHQGFPGIFLFGKALHVAAKANAGKKKTQHFIFSENIIFPCLKQQEQE